MASILKVDKLDPQSGTDLEIGTSGDTITIPSGATIVNSGTATGFGGDNTPNFYAYNTNSQVISTGADTAIIMASEVFDTASAYNTSDGKYTIPSGGDGKWWFKSTIRMVGTGGIPARATIYIFKNASPYLRKETGGNNTYSAVNISGLVEVVATDYIQVYFYQDGGADMTLSQTGSGACYFQGFKLIE